MPYVLNPGYMPVGHLALLLTMLTLILPDLPSLANEIVKPLPDMNI